jgi:hypothetical protein
MALAQSENRHEAEAAMAKAHELIAKYNVEIIGKKRTTPFCKPLRGKTALRQSRDISDLGGLLMDYYFVKCIWIPCWVMEKEKMGRVLEITGTVQNVKIAAYVFDVVRTYIDSQWEKYNKDKGLNFHQKNGFRGRRDRRISRKTEDAKIVRIDHVGSQPSPPRALAKYKDPQLDRFFSYRYPSTRKRSHSANHLDLRRFERRMEDWKKSGHFAGDRGKRRERKVSSGKIARSTALRAFCGRSFQ